jgi:hypothetical protein
MYFQQQFRATAENLPEEGNPFPGSSHFFLAFFRFFCDI